MIEQSFTQQYSKLLILLARIPVVFVGVSDGPVVSVGFSDGTVVSGTGVV